MKVDAVVLGGTGLQETQLRSVQNALILFGIDVFAAHAGEDDTLLKRCWMQGFEIMVTQIASMD